MRLRRKRLTDFVRLRLAYLSPAELTHRLLLLPLSLLLLIVVVLFMNIISSMIMLPGPTEVKRTLSRDKTENNKKTTKLCK